MDVREKLVEICFHEFCMVAGDSPCGCDGCPYGKYGSDDGECYEEYKKDKLAKLGCELPNPKLKEMDLSVRAYNILKRAGLNTAKDIAELDYMQILRIRNLGKHTYDEVIEKLETLGYSTEALMPQPPKGE